MEYNFKEIEEKWRRYWAANKSFKADNNSSKPKYYVLDMFPKKSLPYFNQEKDQIIVITIKGE